MLNSFAREDTATWCDRDEMSLMCNTSLFREKKIFIISVILNRNQIKIIICRRQLLHYLMLLWGRCNYIETFFTSSIDMIYIR